MSGRLEGGRILVVGAGTADYGLPDAPIGNGRAIAVLAAREGATVVCADRDESAAEATAGQIEADGGSAEVVVGDVTSADVCDEIVASAGAITGLVCNVGTGRGGGLAGTTADDWDTTFAVNARESLPPCSGCAAGTGRRRLDRLHQLARRTPAWEQAARLRRVEGRADRLEPSRRPRGRPARAACQRRGAGSHRHTHGSRGLGGPTIAGAHAGAARSPGLGLGGGCGDRVPAVF